MTTATACTGGIIGEAHGGARGNDSNDPNAPAGPTASTVQSLFVCDAPGPQPSKARIVRLNSAQYARTLDVLRRGRSGNANRDRAIGGVASPFQAPSSADRFSTKASSYFVGEAEASAVLESAASLAADVAGDLTNGSCAADGFDEACATTFIREKGALLFGRELDSGEVDTYVALATDSRVEGLGTEAAVTTTLEALLSSPSFLFRSEIGEPAGNGTNRLTPFEIATALSHTLTEGPPDVELWNAAVEGRLSQPEEIRAQVRRLATPIDENPVLSRFVREYFRYGSAESVAKEINDFPFHDPRALVEDTDLFVQEALRRSDASSLLETLLTADWGFVRSGTAESYPYTNGTSPDGAPELVEFGSERRIGIMTQPSWLVAFSQVDHNDVIRRGKFVRESLLCGSIPEIDIGVVPPLIVSEDVTMRESLGQHVSDSGCQGCHSLMDPLGLSFASFDHLGRERDMEAGRPVDATGELTGSGSQDGAFEDAAELMWRLAASEIVRQCFVVHAYEYFRGAARGDTDGCALNDADDVLVAADGDLVTLLEEFFSSDEFLLRVPAEGL